MKKQKQVCAHVKPEVDGIDCCERCMNPMNPIINSRFMSSLMDNLGKPINATKRINS